MISSVLSMLLIAISFPVAAEGKLTAELASDITSELMIGLKLELMQLLAEKGVDMIKANAGGVEELFEKEFFDETFFAPLLGALNQTLNMDLGEVMESIAERVEEKVESDVSDLFEVCSATQQTTTMRTDSKGRQVMDLENVPTMPPGPWPFFGYGGATVFFDFGLTAVPGKSSVLATQSGNSVKQLDVDVTTNVGRVETSGNSSTFAGVGLSYGISKFIGDLNPPDDTPKSTAKKIIESLSLSIGLEFLHSAAAYGGFSFTVSLLLPKGLHVSFIPDGDSSVGFIDISVTITMPDVSCIDSGNWGAFRNGITLGSWSITLLELNLAEVFGFAKEGAGWLLPKIKKFGSWTSTKVRDILNSIHEGIKSSADSLDHLREDLLQEMRQVTPLPNNVLLDPPVIGGRIPWNKLPGLGMAFEIGITIYDNNNGWLWQAYPLTCPKPTPNPPVATPNPPTSPSRSTASLERGIDSLATVDGVRELLQSIGSFFGNKSISTDFCFGDCDPTPVDNKHIAGHAFAAIECTEFVIKAELDDLTVGSVAYIIGGESLWDIVNDVKLEDMGFNNLDMLLTISLPDDITFNVSSTATFLGKQLTATLLGQIGPDPITSTRDTRVSVVGSYNPKPTGKFHFIGTGIDLSLIFVLGKEADMQMGVKFAVCVSDCDSATPQELEFDGSIVLRLPQLDVSASFQMIDPTGWWLNAFGLPFFHLGELVLQLGVDLEEMEPYAFEFGGEICLGKATNCQQQTDPFFTLIGFIGFSDQDPTQNFVAVLITKLTIDEILTIIGEWVPVVNSIDSILPSKVKETGIYPRELHPTGCELTNNRNATDTKTINKDCFAYFMYSGVDKTIPLAGGEQLDILAGVSLSGRLDLLGWNLYADIAVGPTTGMLFNITSDPLKLKIAGADLIDLTSFIDSSKGPNLYMHISDSFNFTLDAQLKMPLILLEAHVYIHADSKVFSFNGDVSLFDGLWKVGVILEWDWDGTYFYLKATDAIDFVIVKVDTVVLNVTDSPAAGVAARFECDITVLFIFAIEGELNYTKTDMSFEVQADVLGVPSGVRGHAKTPDAKIEDADWKLSVYSDLAKAFEELGKDIAKDVSKVVKDVEKIAKEAIDGLEVLGKDLLKAFKTIYDDAKKFVHMLEDDVITPLLDDVKDFLENPAGFMQSGIFDIPGIGTLLKWALVPIHFIIGSEDRSGNFGIDPRSQCIKYWKQHCSFSLFTICVSGWGDTQQWILPACYEANIRIGAQAVQTNSTIAVHQNVLTLTAAKQATLNHLDANASQYKVTAPSMNVDLNGTQPFAHNFAGTFHIPSDAPGFGNLKGINFNLSLDLDPTSNETFTASLRQAIEQVKTHVTKHTAAAIYYKAPIVLQKLNVSIMKASLEDPGNKQVSCNTTNILVKPKMDFDQICQEGAEVVLVNHTVERPGGSQCGVVLHYLSWQGLVPACNMTTEIVNQLITVLPVQPEFETVPNDIIITSWDSDTGTATAKQTCGDHIVWYKDINPTDGSSCGILSFEREWFVAPGGLDCKLDQNTAHPLISTHIQKITIQSSISVEASYLKPNSTDEYVTVPAKVSTPSGAPLTSSGANITTLLPRGLRESTVAYPLNVNTTLYGYNLTCCTDQPCRFAIFFSVDAEKGEIYPGLIKEGWDESTCDTSGGSSVRKNLSKGEYKSFAYIRDAYVLQDHDMPDNLCMSKQGPEGQCQVCTTGPCCDPTKVPREPCPGLYLDLLGGLVGFYDFLSGI